MARKTIPYQRPIPIPRSEKPPSEKSPRKKPSPVSSGSARVTSARRPSPRVINPKSPADNFEFEGSSGPDVPIKGSSDDRVPPGFGSALFGRTRVFTDAETLPTRNALRELKDLIGGAISEDEDEAADGRDRQYIRINLTRPEITTLLQTVVAAEALANAPMWTEGTVDFFKNLELILLQLAKTFRAGGKVIGALTGVSQSVDALLNAIRAFTGSTDDAEVEQDTD